MQSPSIASFEFPAYRILAVVDLTQEALALDRFHIRPSKPATSPSVSFDSVHSNPRIPTYYIPTLGWRTLTAQPGDHPATHKLLHRSNHDLYLPAATNIIALRLSHVAGRIQFLLRDSFTVPHARAFQNSTGTTLRPTHTHDYDPSISIDGHTTLQRTVELHIGFLADSHCVIERSIGDEDGCDSQHMKSLLRDSAV